MSATNLVARTAVSPGGIDTSGSFEFSTSLMSWGSWAVVPASIATWLAAMPWLSTRSMSTPTCSGLAEGSTKPAMRSAVRCRRCALATLPRYCRKKIGPTIGMRLRSRLRTPFRASAMTRPSWMLAALVMKAAIEVCTLASVAMLASLAAIARLV